MSQYRVFTLDDLAKGGLPFGDAKSTGPGRTGPSAGQNIMTPSARPFTGPVKHDPRQKNKKPKGRLYLPLDMPGSGISKSTWFEKMLDEVKDTPEFKKETSQLEESEQVIKALNLLKKSRGHTPEKSEAYRKFIDGYFDLYELKKEPDLSKGEGFVRPHTRTRKGKLEQVKGHRRKLPLMEAMVWQVAKDQGLSRNQAEQMVRASLTVNDPFTGIKHELDPESLVLRVDVPNGTSLIKKHKSFEEARKTLSELREYQKLTQKEWDKYSKEAPTTYNMENIRTAYAGVLKRAFDFEDEKKLSPAEHLVFRTGMPTGFNVDEVSPSAEYATKDLGKPNRFLVGITDIGKDGKYKISLHVEHRTKRGWRRKRLFSKEGFVDRDKAKEGLSKLMSEVQRKEKAKDVKEVEVAKAINLIKKGLKGEAWKAGKIPTKVIVTRKGKSYTQIHWLLPSQIAAAKKHEVLLPEKKEQKEVRNLTDEQLKQKILDDRLISSFIKISLGKRGEEVDYTGMTVDDRFRYLEMWASTKENSKTGGDVPPEFGLKDYDFNIADKIPKDLKTADEVRTFLKENDLIVPTGTKIKKIEHYGKWKRGVRVGGTTHAREDDYYPGNPPIYLSYVLKDLNDDQKNEFVEKVPFLYERLKKQRKYEPSIQSSEVEDFLTTEQLERLSDNFDLLGGKFPVEKLKEEEDKIYDDPVQHARAGLGKYSKVYEVARAELLSGWAAAGGTPAQTLVRNVSQQVFDVNDYGIRFYGGDPSRPYVEKRLKYSPRMLEHVKRLKADTEAFYKNKFKTKAHPNPDLSKRPLVAFRGIGGAVEAYTPAAAESWTTDKFTVDRFGMMMRTGSDDRYTTLQANVTYADVLWSYESAKGWYGWPPDKELKGKKEFVLLGGAVKNVMAEVKVPPRTLTGGGAGWSGSRHRRRY